ncbi:SMI1/KNR4 family protein [Kitasatospora sp. NPDC001683]
MERQDPSARACRGLTPRGHPPPGRPRSEPTEVHRPQRQRRPRAADDRCSTVAEVEAQYGVALPDEYRTFLAEVGAGGPGPALHLTSLCRIDGKWGWLWDTAGHHWLQDPSGPFVETEDWADQQIATLRVAGYEPTTRDEEDNYLDDYRKVFGDAGDEVWHLERGRGAVLISDNGCGMTGWLIVVGPHRGEVRDRDCAVNPPFEPYLDTRGNRHAFRTG